MDGLIWIVAVGITIWLAVRANKKYAASLEEVAPKNSARSDDGTSPAPPELVAISKLILADNRVEHDEAMALLEMLDSFPASGLTPLHRKLHDTTKNALADGTLDVDEAEEIRVLLGEVLDRAPARVTRATKARQEVRPPKKKAASTRGVSKGAVRHSSSIPIGAEVLINYMDAEGAVSEREVLVRRVLRKGGRAYVEGICLMRQAYRTFRADRITTMVVLDTGEYITDVAAAI